MENKITDLKPGERFTFKGYEWAVLDQIDGGVLAIMTKIWKSMCFNNNNNNDYRTSNVRKALLEELLPILGEDNLLPHTVDLITDDGEDLYGAVTDKVFILSCDEYRRYKKSMPKYSNGWVWTCTPWYIDPNYGYGFSVRYISTTGTLNNYYVGNCNEVVPACVFNPERFKVSKQIQVIEA